MYGPRVLLFRMLSFSQLKLCRIASLKLRIKDVTCHFPVPFSKIKFTVKKLFSLVFKFCRDSSRGMSMDGAPVQKSSVHDSIDYILMNFTEMNKLWVRMQYQGHTKDRHLREQERKDLKQLVGANLYALSSLENLTVQIYKNKVLPIVLAQIVNSKDAIAQEYLMEVIIHVSFTSFICYQLEAKKLKIKRNDIYNSK